MPSTNRNTSLAPYVRTVFWATVWYKKKQVFIEQKKCKQMPLTDQIVDFSPLVRTRFWVTICHKYCTGCLHGKFEEMSLGHASFVWRENYPPTHTLNYSLRKSLRGVTCYFWPETQQDSFVQILLTLFCLSFFLSVYLFPWIVWWSIFFLYHSFLICQMLPSYGQYHNMLTLNFNPKSRGKCK